MRCVLEEVVGIEKLKAAIIAQDQVMQLDDLLPHPVANLAKVDFEADAHTYLSEIQMQIDPHKFVPCDPAGKFSDDCVVMFDDGKYYPEDHVEEEIKEEQKIDDDEEMADVS